MWLCTCTMEGQTRSSRPASEYHLTWPLFGMPSNSCLPYRVGVPQVVLPQWLDTYDCATRVEWLGIGIHGSRTTAPGIDAKEFLKALLQVLRNEKIRVKASAIKDLCNRGDGRVVAHDQIVDYCSMD